MIGAIEDFSLSVSLGTDRKFGLEVSLTSLKTELFKFLVTHLFVVVVPPLLHDNIALLTNIAFNCA